MLHILLMAYCIIPILLSRFFRPWYLFYDPNAHVISTLETCLKMKHPYNMLTITIRTTKAVSVKLEISQAVTVPVAFSILAKNTWKIQPLRWTWPNLRRINQTNILRPNGDIFHDLYPCVHQKPNHTPCTWDNSMIIFIVSHPLIHGPPHMCHPTGSVGVFFWVPDHRSGRHGQTFTTFWPQIIFPDAWIFFGSKHLVEMEEKNNFSSGYGVWDDLLNVQVSRSEHLI